MYVARGRVDNVMLIISSGILLDLFRSRTRETLGAVNLGGCSENQTLRELYSSIYTYIYYIYCDRFKEGAL